MTFEVMGAIEYGQFFRRIRRQEDVKQAILAQKLGVSQPAISDIERGDRKDFSEEDVERTLRAIADASGMDSDRYEKILAEGMAAAGFVYIPRNRTPELTRVPDELWPIIHSYNGIPDARERERIRRIMETSVAVYGTEPPEELADYSSIPPKDRPSARPKAGES